VPLQAPPLFFPPLLTTFSLLCPGMPRAAGHGTRLDPRPRRVWTLGHDASGSGSGRGGGVAQARGRGRERCHLVQIPPGGEELEGGASCSWRARAPLLAPPTAASVVYRARHPLPSLKEVVPEAIVARRAGGERPPGTPTKEERGGTAARRAGLCAPRDPPPPGWLPELEQGPRPRSMPLRRRNRSRRQRVAPGSCRCRLRSTRCTPGRPGVVRRRPRHESSPCTFASGSRDGRSRMKEHRVGEEADVWALGCMVLEMATGVRRW
jgi:hypothetical protein